MLSIQTPIAVTKRVGGSPSRFRKRYSCVHARGEVRALINNVQGPHLGKVLEHRVKQLHDGREKAAINLFLLKG